MVLSVIASFRQLYFDSQESMIVRSAYSYVRLLFALESLLITASLVLNVNVFFMGATPANFKYALVLFRGAVIVGIPVVAFIKDSVRWVDQIKSCPRWMWKGALILGIYGLLTFLVLVFFRQGSSSEIDPTFMISGFSLGFDAISICILYSVVWKGYLEKAEVVRRTFHLLVIVGVGAIGFLVYRTGYLHHPTN
jgi:hypothetical protein